MTEPDNSSSNTRPISVAELLAKNGTIGAPPVGGRRRRRRGNADAVTVAELTGEIPIISDRSHDAREEPAADHHADETSRIPLNGAGQQTVTEPEPQTTEADVTEADVTEADVIEADVTETADVTDTVGANETTDVTEPVDSEPGADVSDVIEADEFGTDEFDADEFDADVIVVEVIEDEDDDESVDLTQGSAVGAEEMSPDPLLDDDETAADLGDPPVDLDEPARLERSDDDELPSYLRSSAGPLFGGGTVADDLARRGKRTRTIDEDDLVDVEVEDADEEDLDEEDLHDEAAPDGRMAAFLRGAWIVGQCIIAVAFGAGLFIAFDQLWKWNNIVALVLSVLVILGLVVGVRVVRKTEDIGSTLIAVAVGALVTLGPLALLQSG
ncbi:hypothetical protein [Mycolicibacterium baixiangningiae]|uniref:hypothetical protein n=1 Tax=Mycolicibacterium baixiangningiae TaxID=2761578 RepID=UPI0018D1B7B9|nr:hypothetical protein [Mycolicibacterium baixiangningiae]